MKNNALTALLSAIVALFIVLVNPVLFYFCGWITGHLCNWICGDTLINGINLLFNTTYEAHSLPTLFATASMIASFFSGPTVNKKGE